MIKLSLLMCVYAKENPLYLTQCLDSILAQTVLPDEIIIVKDGPLGEELEAIIESLQFQNDLSIISLPEPVTQGPGRGVGVEAAKHEWIAIMDSDDICRPDRFEKQLKMIETDPKLGLIGGQTNEFETDPNHPIATRAVPTNHNGILKFLKKRNPFNHMTVMFQRELAMQAGNYKYFPYFEDYDLWTRMIKNGALCANHPDVLVNVRVGSGMYSRRRGMQYIKAEWRMQKQLRRYGIINKTGILRNTVVRIPVRILPEKLLAKVYKRFVREVRSQN